MSAPQWLRAVAAELPAAARTALITSAFLLGLLLGAGVALEVLS